jgi:hypothetical protein
MSTDKNQEYLLNCNWNNNFEIPLPLFPLTPLANFLSLVIQVVHKIMGPKSKYDMKWKCMGFNPLNAELNPICHLLVLLGAHPILHVSRIKVKNVQ